jgi:hypothetical protein
MKHCLHDWLGCLSSGDTRLDTLIRLTCGRALSLPPLPSEVDLIDGASDHEAMMAAKRQCRDHRICGVCDHGCRETVNRGGSSVG